MVKEQEGFAGLAFLFVFLPSQVISPDVQSILSPLILLRWLSFCFSCTFSMFSLTWFKNLHILFSPCLKVVLEGILISVNSCGFHPYSR